MDERAREHATMFAFGLPVGTVVRLAMLENLILGVFATAVGLAGGWSLLRLIMATRVPDTFPDIYIKAQLDERTLALTVILGIVVVALAPLLMWRRLTAMNVPATLKVVE
jgi:putative ABC transport system permease protein